MSHPNARLTPRGRLLLVERILAGYRVSDVAAQLGCSRTCAYKWLYRYRTEGVLGLTDRSSRPRRTPHRIDAGLEQAIVQLRTSARRGAEWIAAELGICAATVGRVLRRHGMPHLSELDALTGIPVRRGPATRVRYERERPGELIHIDVKKLGRIPTGGGWRAMGAPPGRAPIAGPDSTTCMRPSTTTHVWPMPRSIPMRPVRPARGCSIRAADFFAGCGITRIERVMTDNAFAIDCRTIPGRPCAPGSAPGAHPAPLPLAKRQSGALQPHAAGRMGVSPPIRSSPTIQRAQAPAGMDLVLRMKVKLSRRCCLLMPESSSGAGD